MAELDIDDLLLTESMERTQRKRSEAEAAARLNK